jgi:hypothetical protein
VCCNEPLVVQCDVQDTGRVDVPGAALGSGNVN